MKQAEIKNDTDYIIGPSANLWEGVGYANTDLYADRGGYLPWRMNHVRVVDPRPHKVWNGYRSSEDKITLVPEGEKPNRSHYIVGPLVVIVKADGTLTEPTVVRPQAIRMEWNAWVKEYAKRHQIAKERRALARKEREEEERRNAEEKAERVAKVIELNKLLEGTDVEAKSIGGSIVLTGSSEALLDLAHAGQKENA